jgi:hypothetical protein
MAINNKLIEIGELLDILGYSDVRSVRKFCEQNKIPLFNLGKKTYTVTDFLDIVIAKQLGRTYDNADEILKAISTDNKEELANLIDAPLEEKVKTDLKTKNRNSNAAKKLIDKLNAA